MTQEEIDLLHMKAAISAAQYALTLGEVPIGAVLVWDEGTEKEQVIAVSHNTRETEKNALGHAECNAIIEACRVLGGWRLHRATLYVTVEPCPMCAGAIINARIKRIVYGAKDDRAGAFSSVLRLQDYPLNHKPEITAGVLEEECASLMRAFFEKLRKQRLTEPVRRTKQDFMK